MARHPIKLSKRLKPDDLTRFRREQPGRYRFNKHGWKPGWSQTQAAHWLGVSLRSWNRWERGQRPIPMYVERAILARRTSLNQILDKVFTTPEELVDELGGIYEGDPGTYGKKLLARRTEIVDTESDN